MFSALLAVNGKSCLLMSFLRGIRAIANAYIETFQLVVKRQTDNVANGLAHIFQRVSALSHTALESQDWLGQNFHDHVTLNLWPPKTSYINPLDYYVRSVVEKEINKHRHKPKSSVMEAVDREKENINKDHLIKAQSRFRTRIE